MKAPMILHWLARKWGVSDERALALWVHACDDAFYATGERDTSRYWGKAKSRLMDLLDEEVLATHPASQTPWLMINLSIKRVVAHVRIWLSNDRRRAFG